MTALVDPVSVIPASPHLGRSARRPAAPESARLVAIEGAVLRAIAYADVFDWPRTGAELRRYLPVSATPDEVSVALRALAGRGAIEVNGRCVTLAGRPRLVDTRREREAASRGLWQDAVRWGRAVSRLPFVRMVAVTGSLAVSGANAGDDIDLLVVTTDGRLWLTRALAMGVVRAARALGVRLCPNYLVAESALEIEDRNGFTAHELVQMVPISGMAVYRQLMRRNAWFRDYLPNGAAPGLAEEPGPRPQPGLLRRVAEAALRAGVVDRLERWEMRRKVARLSAAASSTETRYDPTCCKGHANEHGRRVLAAYEARLRELGEGA